MPRVAMVTCAELPDLDADERLVIPHLRDLGVDAVPAVWDDAGVDWSLFDLAVIRSPWDYHVRRDEFLKWAASVPRLANPEPIVSWNTDKRYLRDLAAAGNPVVPTSWLEPGDRVELPVTGEYVVKPAVSAGSVDTGRYDLGADDHRDLAIAHAERLLARGATVMVQPYLSAVDTAGETALLFIGGSFSHAIRKGALLDGPDRGTEGLYKPEEITSRTPAQAEFEVAADVLAAVPGGADQLLYARVDLVPGPDGSPVLLELELTEPSLFLGHDAAAARRLAEAIVARI
ncbi:MAG: ATP-grasp domain-containing protein [Jiangellaceae bacterium]